MEMWLRKPTSKNPMVECFYEEKGDLVDEGHEYSWCGGTPDQYGKDSPFEHSTIDSGGILREGFPAAYETIRKGVNDIYDSANHWLDS